MNESSFASSEGKVYRFNRFYRWYHFVVGSVFLVTAVVVHDFLILSILVALFSVFMIARPIVTSVTLDQYSVTVKGMFSEGSLRRSFITAIETRATGRGTLLILRSDTDEKEELTIGVNLFAFDDAWDDWLKTYRNLSHDKPLNLFVKS